MPRVTTPLTAKQIEDAINTGGYEALFALDDVWDAAFKEFTEAAKTFMRVVPSNMVAISLEIIDPEDEPAKPLPPSARN